MLNKLKADDRIKMVFSNDPTRAAWEADCVILQYAPALAQEVGITETSLRERDIELNKKVDHEKQQREYSMWFQSQMG